MRGLLLTLMPGGRLAPRRSSFLYSIELFCLYFLDLTETVSLLKLPDFEILAFPCNQFLRQEPGTAEQAKDFACTRFKAEYPVFQKVRTVF